MMIDKSVVEPEENRQATEIANGLWRFVGMSFLMASADHYFDGHAVIVVIGLYLYIEGLLS